MNDKEFLERLNSIEENLNEINIQNDNIKGLKSYFKKIKKDIDTIKTDDKIFKIGIIGQIKAGKSSFINALLFDGQKVLPTAATPKTASLTKVTYSEEERIDIKFFDKETWNEIREKALEYNKINTENESNERKKIFNSPYMKELKSSKEIYDMINDPKRFNILNELGNTKTIKIEKGESIEEIMDSYVGEDGIYTPIVHSVDVYINNKDIEDIYIVDTPGLNDTAISRSIVTEQFISECHAVFILSQASNFLDSVDMELIMQALPANAVKKIKILGSQIDLALLSYNEKEKIKGLDFKKAYSKIIKEANERAYNNISSYPNYNNIIDNLKESLPPQYISSMFYKAYINKKNNIEFEDDLNNVINSINDKFYNFEEAHLLQLSGINNIKRDFIKPIIEDKNRIIEEKIGELTSVQISNILKTLEDINIGLINDLDKIKNSDIESLREEEEDIKNKLNSFRNNIKHIFINAIIEVKNHVNEIKYKMNDLIDKYEYLDVKEEKHNDRKVIHTGFLGLKKDYYNVTITEKTVAVKTVVKNIRNYSNYALKTINQDFKNIFNIDELKIKIKSIISQVINKKSKNFNENDVLIPIENALKSITIPVFKVDDERYRNQIISYFSHSVIIRGNDIAQLELQQELILKSLRDDLILELDKKVEEIENNLTNVSSNFIDTISSDLSKNIDTIIKAIENRKSSVEEYSRYINIILKSKELLNNL